MARIRSFEFAEKVPGSPKFGFLQDRSRCVRVFDVEWEQGDWFVAAYEILGYPVLVTNEAGTRKYIQRTTPIAYPGFVNSEGRPFLFATAINDVQPVGFRGKTRDDVARYQLARMEVEFNTLTYDIRTDAEVLNAFGEPDESTWSRYVTKLVKPDAQYLSLPRGSMKFCNQMRGDPQYRDFFLSTDPPTSVPESVGKIVSTYEVRLTWHQVPKAAVRSRLINPSLTAAEAYLDRAMGKVNSHDWNGFEYGTLLLLGYEPVPIVSAFGDRLYDIHFSFKYAPFKHNRIFWPTAGAELPGPPEQPPFSAEGGPPGYVRISVDGSLYLENTSPPDGKQVFDVYPFHTHLMRVY